MRRISSSGNQARIALPIEVACDVDNPLCGPRGAAAVYGPQKGAMPEQVHVLDSNLAHLAELIKRDDGWHLIDKDSTNGVFLNGDIMPWGPRRPVPRRAQPRRLWRSAYAVRSALRSSWRAR